MSFNNRVSNDPVLIEIEATLTCLKEMKTRRTEMLAMADDMQSYCDQVREHFVNIGVYFSEEERRQRVEDWPENTSKTRNLRSL